MDVARWVCARYGEDCTWERSKCLAEHGMITGPGTVIHGVFCRFCGTPTPMIGTKECDRCWELRTRIEGDPVLAAEILAATLRERGLR